MEIEAVTEKHGAALWKCHSREQDFQKDTFFIFGSKNICMP